MPAEGIYESTWKHLETLHFSAPWQIPGTENFHFIFDNFRHVLCIVLIDFLEIFDSKEDINYGYS